MLLKAEKTSATTYPPLLFQGPSAAYPRTVTRNSSHFICQLLKVTPHLKILAPYLSLWSPVFIFPVSNYLRLTLFYCGM